MFESWQAKKEGESEEMTHLTQEGSLEDTMIVVRFYCDFNPNDKKDELVNARLNCSSATSCARFNVSIHFL